LSCFVFFRLVALRIVDLEISLLSPSSLRDSSTNVLYTVWYFLSTHPLPLNVFVDVNLRYHFRLCVSASLIEV
jgi:hypothetical protein